MTFPDVFVNEDVSKAENRVNLALFSLMQQTWFREWFLMKLKLPRDTVVYPAKTQENNQRPDFRAAAPDGKSRAWIEIELSKNQEQLERYQKVFAPDIVKSVWGAPEHGGNLSLKQIADFVDERITTGTLADQVAVNAKHLRDAINTALEEHSAAQGRAAVSGKMRGHRLVTALENWFGPQLLFDLGSSERPLTGQLKADTTTNGDNGFSLRVRRYDDKPGTVSLLNITSGTDIVYFPSKLRLSKCLPLHDGAIDNYVRFLCGKGIDISLLGEAKKESLPLGDVLNDFKPLAECLSDLADLPGNCGSS